jgi:beta-phosphoglucomutase
VASRFTHAFIFDLDGVITDTARQHLAAWRDLAQELGLPFDPQIGERLKGLSRMDSLDLLLAGSPRTFSRAEREQLAERKNVAYVASLADMSAADLLPGARPALQAVRDSGWGLALASASKNAQAVLARLGIAGLFHCVVFLTAALALAVPPTRCVGIEDAVAGVQAVKGAGMFAVGIGDPQVLTTADVVMPDLLGFHPAAFLR